MATTASQSLNTVYDFDGSSTYVDYTKEARTRAGTSFTVFSATSKYLYLGHDEKFDMVLFDIDTAGSLGALTWEYSNGTNWTEFAPSYDRLTDDGSAYGFDKDGGEIFLDNIVSDWATLTVNSVNIYWIRVRSAASVATSPTIKSIEVRPRAAYCSTKDVFNFLQLGHILSSYNSSSGGTTAGTDFTASTVPSKDTVEKYIQAAQAQIDYRTRKSWRPNIMLNEEHNFNIFGFKLDRKRVQKVLTLEVWDGNSYEAKTEGRNADYFYVPDTNMIHFSRFFYLPARFASLNSPTVRFGGGEFVTPVRVSYIYGDNVTEDVREGAFVTELTKKIASIDILRNSDFGEVLVGGSDRVSMQGRVDQYQREVDDTLEMLKSFEVF